MDLILVANELMPEGKPDCLSMVKYPKINELVETMGKKQMLTILTLMVKDFCSSLNVVRNMNEDQMIEAAAMLLDECDNFRLQDYVLMFTMAKRGKFHPQVKILDRIDIQLISSLHDHYYEIRKAAGMRYQEQEVIELEGSVGDQKALEWKEQTETMITLAGAIEKLKAGMMEEKTTTYDQAREQLEKNPNYKFPYLWHI